MKKRNLFAIGVALYWGAMGLTSCSSECDEVWKDDVVDIRVLVNGQADSRAASAYAPAEGTKLTLYAGSVADASPKAEYTYSGSSWNNTEPLPWSTLTATAGNTYSFFAVAPAPFATSGSVSTDQSSEENYIASDMLMAYTTTGYGEIVDLELQHLMGMMEVNLINGLSMTENVTLTLTAIDGLKTNYTVTASDNSLWTVTATDVAVKELKPYKNGSLYQFIAPAQTLASGLKLYITATVGGTETNYTYTYTDASHTLVAGKKTVLNISVGNEGIYTVTYEGTTVSMTLNELLTFIRGANTSITIKGNISTSAEEAIADAFLDSDASHTNLAVTVGNTAYFIKGSNSALQSNIANVVNAEVKAITVTGDLDATKQEAVKEGISGHTGIHLSLPETTVIGEDAFWNCFALAEITLGNVTGIGESAFWKCINLVTVNGTISGIIESGAFQDCSALTGITLGDVTEIGGYAFDNCTGMRNLTLQSVVTVVETHAFFNVGNGNCALILASGQEAVSGLAPDMTNKIWADNTWASITITNTNE